MFDMVAIENMIPLSKADLSIPKAGELKSTESLLEKVKLAIKRISLDSKTAIADDGGRADVSKEGMVSTLVTLKDKLKLEP